MAVVHLATLSIAGAAYAHGGDTAIPWLRILLAFLFCIAVAFAAILWLRARQGLSLDFRSMAERLVTRIPSAPRQIEIEERLRVSPASQILLLRCGERRYLVHVGPQGAQKIDRLEDIDRRDPETEA